MPVIDIVLFKFISYLFQSNRVFLTIDCNEITSPD